VVDERRREMEELERAVDERRAVEREAQEAMAEAAKAQDKLLNKRTMLLEAMQQKQRLIRELGTLPRQEMQDFKDFTEKQLLSKLKDVNDQLKKYASVNRKALDQYVNFNEQRENLIERRDELARDKDKIQQLVESLDQQKEEAILRTFRGVSEHFKDVFSELVPGGEGQLIMRTTDEDVDFDGQDGGEGGDGGESEALLAPGTGASISSFQGVQVRVTFSGGGQQFDMQQLSGGQKALVALALIFAIQRSDPAPFYLFDEIDQALDANYRSGVARLIQKQAESKDAPAQFITTTFRPELVNVAHKFYGIAMQNKVSSIYPLDKVDAQSFVTNLMNEEEAVGQVSAVPSYARAARLSAAADLDDQDQDLDQDRGDEDDEEENDENGGGNRGRGLGIEDEEEDEDEGEEASDAGVRKASAVAGRAGAGAGAQHGARVQSKRAFAE
jgi:structural maintenance of chromosome 3 (chondroitin sulfate proteoglycan 6)